MNEYCFLPGPARLCSQSCMAYVQEGKTCCRILNSIERLTTPPATRPTVPPPPKVNT